MLHQTLLNSSSSSSSHLPYSHSSQVEIEREMESAELSPMAGGDMASVLGEDFSVDDLLNFNGGELGDDEETKIEAKQEEEEEEEESNSNTSLSSSSAVSLETPPAPPPPISELTLPTHDVAELEWVSRIMDESQSEIPRFEHPAPKMGTQKHSQQLTLAPVKAKRSKRARSLSVSWSSGGGGPLHLTDLSNSSSTTTTTTSSASSSSSSSASYSSYSSQLIFAHHMFDEMPLPEFKKQKPKKKRGRKPKQAMSQEISNNNSGGGERRCSHCGVTKTPQWRTGPMGAKTLCNACGVRYKSGRLLPEYRPACSPTFISHVHSNSHRKVLEMRRKKEEKLLSY